MDKDRRVVLVAAVPIVLMLILLMRWAFEVEATYDANIRSGFPSQPTQLRAQVEQCPFEPTNSTALTKYLEQAKAKPTDPDCVALAIRRLGSQHYRPATATLIKFLDFHRPRNADEKAGVFSMEARYPAVTALAEIGDNSLPFLSGAIQSESTSPQARENAVESWMQIYKYKPSQGIRRLRQDAYTTKDAAAKQRLLEGVSKALYWCAPSDERMCVEAARH